MFTVCPKCGLTLVVTAADLRVAQGYVRCGRCSNVFNALARLSEDRQNAAAAAQAQQNASRPAQPAAPAAAAPSAAAPAPPPPPSQALTEDDEDEAIPEAALEFNPDADVSQVFVEPPPNPEWTAATGSFKAIVLRNEEPSAPSPPAQAERAAAPAPVTPAAPSARGAPTPAPQAPATPGAATQVPPSARSAAQSGTLSASSGRSASTSAPTPPAPVTQPQAVSVRSVRQTPPPRPTPIQPSSPPPPSSYDESDSDGAFDVELDAELLSAGAQARAVVQAREQQEFGMPASTSEEEEEDDEAAEELELDGDSVTSTMQPAARQRGGAQAKSTPPSQFAPQPKPAPLTESLPGESRAGASRGTPRPQPASNTSRSPFDIAQGERVAPMVRPRPGSAERRSTNLLWTAGTCVLALVLVAQVVHHYRHDLAANARLNGPLTSLYTSLGIPLVPRWDLHAYDVRQLGASVEGTNSGQITVRASVKNSAQQAQPLPLLRVTLQDRYGNRIAARDVPPQSYLPRAIPPSSLLSAGQRIDAEMAFVDPGTNAVGFEIDACLPAPGGGISCANDPH